MMSCSLSPYVDDAKVADVVIPHALRRPHVQGPQYMHKFLLVDRSSNLYTNSFQIVFFSSFQIYNQFFDQTNTFISRAENQFISKNMGSRLKNPETRPTQHVES